MEKLFENKTTYSEDVYMEFVEFHNKTHNLSYIAYTVFWSAVFALCMYLAFSIGNIYQGTLVTVILIGFLLYRIFRPNFLVKKELKSDKIANNNTNIFSFFEKNFKVQNGKGNFDFKYLLLYKVYETSDYFYLYVNRENAFLVSKKSFTMGTSKDFSNFIKNKCKLKYRLKK